MYHFDSCLSNKYLSTRDFNNLDLVFAKALFISMNIHEYSQEEKRLLQKIQKHSLVSGISSLKMLSPIISFPFLFLIILLFDGSPSSVIMNAYNFIFITTIIISAREIYLSYSSKNKFIELFANRLNLAVISKEHPLFEYIPYQVIDKKTKTCYKLLFNNGKLIVKEKKERII